ncbi:hypothetical protein [Massilia sp. METH4]|uniref:hypothetical protein n=1 Tax=Massilia sp. METH4 TaxID=3123041 RepID=UPI0030D4E1A6
MKLKSFVIAALAAGTVGGASAKTVDITLAGGPQTWTSFKVSATHTAGSFSDTFTFSN